MRLKRQLAAVQRLRRLRRRRRRGGADPPTTNPYAPTGGFNGGAGGFTRRAPVSTPFGCSNFATPGASGAFPPQPGMHQGCTWRAEGLAGRCPGCPTSGRCRRPSRTRRCRGCARPARLAQPQPRIGGEHAVGGRAAAAAAGGAAAAAAAAIPGRRGARAPTRRAAARRSGSGGGASERSDEDKSQYVIDLGEAQGGAGRAHHADDQEHPEQVQPEAVARDHRAPPRMQV